MREAVTKAKETVTKAGETALKTLKAAKTKGSDILEKIVKKIPVSGFKYPSSHFTNFLKN